MQSDENSEKIDTFRQALTSKLRISCWSENSYLPVFVSIESIKGYLLVRTCLNVLFISCRLMKKFHFQTTRSDCFTLYVFWIRTFRKEIHQEVVKKITKYKVYRVVSKNIPARSDSGFCISNFFLSNTLSEKTREKKNMNALYKKKNLGRRLGWTPWGIWLC